MYKIVREDGDELPCVICGKLMPRKEAFAQEIVYCKKDEYDTYFQEALCEDLDCIVAFSEEIANEGFSAYSIDEIKYMYKEK